MMSLSLIEQIKCRWREFLREPSAFFWVLFMPILWMVVLGFAFSDDTTESYAVGISEEFAISEIVETLQKDPEFKVQITPTSELPILLKRGTIMVAVEKLGISNDGGSVVYSFDSSNPQAKRARDRLDNLIQRAAGRKDIVQASDEEIKAERSRYVDFLIPGLLGLSIMTSSLFGVAMTIVANRRENLLKRYLATPMKPYEYIVSHIFGRFFVLVAETLAVLIGGYLIHSFVVDGPWVSFIMFAMLGAASFTGVGLLCAARTKSIPAVSGVTNLIVTPMMLVSGVFFSIAGFPDALLTLVSYLPLTALVNGLRKIALEGQSITALGFESAVLAVYLVITVVLTKKMFRWY